MPDFNMQQKVWMKIVAKAWADEGYKQRLLADPAAVLKTEGVEVPEGVAFKCLEATATQAWLVLPANPTDVGGACEGEERLAAGGSNYF